MDSSQMQQSLAQLILNGEWILSIIIVCQAAVRIQAWADLSVEVDTESLQVDVPQQCHLPAVTMMTLMIILDTDDDSAPEDAGRGGAGGGHVLEQLLHPHQTPGQGPGHLGV